MVLQKALEEPRLQLSDLFDKVYSPTADGIPGFKLFIGGKWVTSSTRKVFEIKTPINGAVIARVQQAGEPDVEDTIEAAYENRQAIRDIPGIERVEIFHEASRILLDNKEDFVRTIMLEAGKPEKEAEGEVRATSDRMKLTMEEVRKIFGEYIPGDWSEDTSGKVALVIREPIGVVTAISPFNYPLFIGAAKIIPALLAGNSVVAKPASADPISLILFGRILEAAGIPDGVVNIVTGSGPTIGEALVSDDRVGMVSFTGSTEVGKHVHKVAGLKKLHLELGGKGMAVVLDDADLDLAARKCVEGALKNAGQRCDAISAILVIDSVADAFTKKVLTEVARWRHGDPRNSSVMVGPVINELAATRIHELVQDAILKGAKLLRGGKHSGGFYEPTVLDHVPLTARISSEETFGPVVTIIRIKHEDEAIEIGRRSRYGLDSCVFTNNFYRMWKLAKRLLAGGISINDLPRHGVGFFPFGGSKESGIGREGIGYSIDEMTNLKTIVFNLEPAGLGKTPKIAKR